MFSIIKSIGTFTLTIKGWIFIMTAIVPTLAAFVMSLLEGLPWSIIIVITVNTLAAMMLTLYYLVRFIDYATRFIGDRRAHFAVAGQLREVKNSGFEVIAIDDIVTMWSDGDQSTWVWYPRLRQIKQAVKIGKVRMHKEVDNSNLTKDTYVYIADVIDLFESGDIKNMVWRDDLPSPEPSEETT